MERIVEKSAKEAKVQAKKIRGETPDFTRAGNKGQFDHNVAVTEHIDAALHHLKEAEVKEAMDILEQGKEMIAQRQKFSPCRPGA